jgi:hypothetical protein
MPEGSIDSDEVAELVDIEPEVEEVDFFQAAVA